MSEVTVCGGLAHRREVVVDELECGDGADDDDRGGTDVGVGEFGEGPPPDHLRVGGGRLDGGDGCCRGEPPGHQFGRDRRSL